MTCSQVDHAANYLRSAANFYKTEEARELVITDLLNLAIGEAGVWKSTVEVDGGISN